MIHGLEHHDSQSLLKAIETMLPNLETLQTDAQRAAAVWSAEHNEKKLLDCLLTGEGLATRSRSPVSNYRAGT